MSKKTIQLCSAVLLCLSAFIFTSCRMQPVLNVQNQSIHQASIPGKDLTEKQIETAILQACKDRGWIAKVASPGSIQADLSLRSFFAAVEIKYDTTQYSINYMDSKNLNYDGARINRHYNSWVNNLSKSINANLFKVSGQTK